LSLDLDPRNSIRITAEPAHRPGVRPLLNVAYRFDVKHGGRLAKNFGKGITPHSNSEVTTPRKP